MNRVCSLLAVILAVLLAIPAFAQSDNAPISGIVKDPTGAAVPNAKVTVRNEGTGFERVVNTNETGFFTATNLAPGYYTVIVEAAGFKQAQRTRNKLEAALPLAVNVDLVIGGATEVVNVEASVAQLNTESATVGKTVEQKQIQNLTLNGRNPLFLAMLKPGVRRGSGLSGFSYSLDSGGFTINGGRSQDSLITYDGAVGIRTRANGTSVGVADVDMVQEVQVLTANYSAEYGRSGNGQIRIVTKSGGKQFHGALHELVRNDKLFANSWDRNRFTNTNFVAPEKFNQFGWNLSGPVSFPGFNKNREKLFFAYAQEYVRRRFSGTLQARVPTAAMRTGNFSELLSPNIFYNNTAAAATVRDPDTNQPFPNNTVPANRLSANGTAMLRAYYAPNGTFGNNNWLLVRPGFQNQRKDNLALDYNPTGNQFVKFRFSHLAYTGLDTSRGSFDYAITDWSRPNITSSLGHTWTVTPTTINEFMASASVDRVVIGIDRTGERYLRSRSGINYPYLYPERKEISDKLPTIEIPNLSSIDGGPYPASSAGPIYQLSNNLTKVAGNHTWKFGVLFERSGQNDFDQINVSGVPGGTNNQNGRFIFNDARPGGAAGTGNGIANAAMGLFSSYAEIGPRAYTPYRSHMFEFFGQDSWRVSSKLKLELGVRGTWMNGYYKSLWGNIAYFDPAKYDPSKAATVTRDGSTVIGDRFNGVVIPGKAFPEAGKGRVPAIDSGEFNRLLSGGSDYPTPNQFDLMPRVGMAYSMTNKDVFRIGGGGFMSRPGVYDSVFLGGNPPWQPMASVSNGSADNPGGASRAAFPQFFMTIDPVYKVPRGYNWNATYQRQLTGDTVVEAGYVGSVGNFLSRERDLNQLPTGTMFRSDVVANAAIGQTRANENFVRPYKGFANVPMLEHSGRSTYHGLQFELNRRFNRGFLYGFAYTLSKTMDNNSGPRDGFIDVYNQSLNWGKSANDVRHIAIVNFVWEMPFFSGATGVKRALLGGWQMSGVNQWQTGTPITIGNGDDYLGIGSTNGKPWNLNGEPNRPKQFSERNAAGNFTGITTQWVERTVNGQAWATKPADGTLPNQNRNSISFNNLGFQNWNLAMFKSFRIIEGHNLQFKAEGFNWINHPNLGGGNGGGIDTNPTSATFGMVTGKGSERQIALSLRYSF